MAEGWITVSANDQWGQENHPVICKSSCIHLAFIRLVINRPPSSGSGEQTVSAWPLTLPAECGSITLNTENELWKHKHEGSRASKAVLIFMTHHAWKCSIYLNHSNQDQFHLIADSTCFRRERHGTQDWLERTVWRFITLPLVSFLRDSLSFWTKVSSDPSISQLSCSTSALTTYL